MWKYNYRMRKKLRNWYERPYFNHEELHKLHSQYEKYQNELHRQHQELERKLRESQNNMDSKEMMEEYEKLRADFIRKRHEHQKRFRELRKSHRELYRMHRHVRLSPPIILIVNFIIWCLVFRYAGIKVISVFFAILFSVGGFLEYFFIRKIESRILIPINKLKKGLNEISKGNYNVKIESSQHNEISQLIDSFNDMAQKLQESERIKAEYEENRRMLIANISHDLKTPITSIQGYIEAINEGNAIPPENINRYLKIIHNNTAYINKLIDDLFLFSKLDMQKLELQFVTVDVRSCVNDLMEEFKIELEERDIKFDFSDELEADCIFNIDRKRLHQVFRNIIGNAVKYGSEQNLFIRTKLYKLDDYIYIDIEDNGPGISKDKLPHIFDRFYRIDSERTKDFMSTGLGLAIAKELTEAHGGRITVASKENNGTCFTVVLPIVKN